MEPIICRICQKSFKDGIGSHLRHKHKLSLKEYYNQFLKKENEGICLVCKTPTEFLHIRSGYRPYCSHSCYKLSDTSIEKRKQTNQQKYGCENPFQSSIVKEQIKQSNLKKYGVENPSQSLEIKQKKRETTLKNYGVENPSLSKEIRAKANATNLERYGSENVMHVKEIAELAALNGGGKASAERYITKFGNEILVQGSYEKEFITLCENNNVYVENGPCIWYDWHGEKHKYFIDFKIKYGHSWHLIEIKSSYWYDKFKEQIDAKRQAAIKWCDENNVGGYHLLIDKIELPEY